MKTKGISASAYEVIMDCMDAELNRLMEKVRKASSSDAIAQAELLGKLKAARSEFIHVHVA